MANAAQKTDARASIRSRVPEAEYRALAGVNVSSLKEMRRSPLHYRHRLLNPKDSAPLTFGSATHVAILEPERFDRDHAVWGERTDSGKLRPRNGKLWESFEAANDGKRILTADEHAEIIELQRAVRCNALAMRYLRRGDPEVTMTWTDGPFACKGRVDWLTTDSGLPTLVGLKTARNAAPFVFGSAAAKLGYHLQWAFYHDGYEAITGRAPRLVEIVVESDAPYDIVVYNIPSDVIDQGRDEYRACLEKLAECQREGRWPGVAESEQHLTLPTWAYERESDDLTDVGLAFD